MVGIGLCIVFLLYNNYAQLTNRFGIRGGIKMSESKTSDIYLRFNPTKTKEISMASFLQIESSRKERSGS
jgi:hypothetical protein